MSQMTDDFDRIPQRNADVIRQHSRSFSLAAGLLPKRVRGDVQKLYAWCRWCDDAVDLANDSEHAAMRLAVLREDVERIYRGMPPVHEASIWLAELVDEYEIEKELPLGLLDGMETDLRLGQIQNESELMRYCYQAAGVVGLMMCRIFGVTDRRAARHAKSLGIAMQLTNIARDVREDFQRGRCYLPATWFRPNPSCESPGNAEVRSSVQRLLELADEHYSIGNAGIRYLPKSVRAAVRIAASVYREIGQQIRRRGFRVMDGRVTIAKSRFAMTAIQAWAGGTINELSRTIGLPLGSPTKPDSHSPFPPATELTMNDAKYLAYLGISLTAFMGTALFVLVMINPKEESYSTLPLIYAGVCLAIGIATNLLAKHAEKPIALPLTNAVDGRSSQDLP